MKKLFAIAVLGSVMLVSCKKSSSGGLGQGTVQATINGTTSTFSAVATGTSSDGGKFIEIESADGTNLSTANQFTIIIAGNSAITTGTYSDTTVTSEFANTGLEYFPGGTTNYVNDNLASSPITVTVTSISSTQIQGTFQGNLYLNQDSSSTKKTVTNGKFNVKLTVQ